MNGDRVLMRAIYLCKGDKGPVNRFQELILPKKGESEWLQRALRTGHYSSDQAPCLHFIHKYSVMVKWVLRIALTFKQAASVNLRKV